MSAFLVPAISFQALAQDMRPGFQIGARMRCILEFNRAGITPMENDPRFQNCVGQGYKQNSRAYENYRAQKDRENRKLQDQINQKYGR
jgi:hypothetical protein